MKKICNLQILYSFYYTLYYYQTIVEQLGIYCGQAHKKVAKRQQNENTLKIAKPFHVKFLTFTFTLFAVKCFVTAFISSATNTRTSRILLGVEYWRHRDTFTITETTFLLWTLIALLFLSVTISSDDPLDYRFLALFRVEERRKLEQQQQQQAFLQPKAVGLSRDDYFKFSKLRQTVVWYYHSIMWSLGPVSFLALIISNNAAGVFQEQVFLAVFWVIVNTAWVFLAIAGKLIHFNF